MSSERRAVGEDRLAADTAIVRHMAIGHEETPIADDRLAPASGRAAVHGHVLADRAVRADDERRRFAFVGDRLRRAAEAGERMDDRARADLGAP